MSDSARADEHGRRPLAHRARADPLTARAVEIIHSLDRDAERIVSFDRPWGEYLSRGAVDFSPLHFADAARSRGWG